MDEYDDMEMEEEKQTPGLCLLEYLREHHLDEYGSVISAAMVRHILGITLPTIGTRKEFTDAAMRELSGIDYVRNVLLQEGKYLTQSRGDYRILLPSENAGQVQSYMSAADRKLRRAATLARNTPPQATGVQDINQLQSRIEVKRASINQPASRDIKTPPGKRMPPGVRPN